MPEQATDQAECYAVFNPRETPGLTLSTCFDEEGGFYILTNNTGQPMSACWSMQVQFFLNSRDGMTLGNCNSLIRDQEEVRYTCFSCKPGEGGPVKGVTWSVVRKVEDRRRRRN